MSASGPIPLFPLHTVLFPRGALPLHIFEARYRRLVEERRDFGVVLIREGREVGSVPSTHEVGTLACLERVEALADGRFNVLARGVRRFRVVSLLDPDPYLRAEVAWLEDEPRMLRVWRVGSWLQVEAAKRQALLESGSPEMARDLLREELERLRRHGRTVPVPPPRFSSN